MTVTILSVIATVFSLSGNLLVNYKKRSGFIIWTIANILWIYVNIISELNISQCIMFLCYGALNVMGFIKWRKEDKKDKIGGIINE